MPDSFTWNKFDSGWIPSDDAVNGRKTGFLQMDNVVLDQNGAVTLQNGTAAMYSISAPVHTFFDVSVDGGTTTYAALQDGSILQQIRTIATGGDSRVAAFETAFDYILIASGNVRLKAKGDSSPPVNLGITANTTAPFLIDYGLFITPPFYPANWFTYIDTLGTSNSNPSYTFPAWGIWSSYNYNGSTFPDGDPSSSTFLTSNLIYVATDVDFINLIDGYTTLSGFTFNVTRNNNGQWSGTVTGNVYTQSYGNGPSTMDTKQGFEGFGVSLDKLLFGGLAFPYIITPSDNFRLRPGLTSTASDTDILFGNVTSLGANGDSIQVNSITFEFLLSPSNSNGDPVTNYFTGTWTNPTPSTQPHFQLFSISRKDFTLVGQGTWAAVYGVKVIANISLAVTNNVVLNNASIEINYEPSFIAQDFILDGTYEYATINVNNTGTYVGKSVLSPVYTGTTKIAGYGVLRIFKPTDPQVTEVWLFRRGGTLDEWYRVAVEPIASFDAGYFDLVDSFSDQDAITEDITVNVNLVSIAASSIPERICKIIGPIEGRWFYFTEKFMYPSDINDPDLVDASRGIRISDGSNEKFYWAQKVGAAQVLVGTSKDIYVLSGTFQTLPDNTVDIYYQPLQIAFPPITANSVVLNGQIYYQSNDGWRVCNALGQSNLLVAGTTELLYLGKDRYGYSAATVEEIVDNAPFNCPITIAKNKLWCAVATNTVGIPTRLEIYDFERKYWRVGVTPGYNITALHGNGDGAVIASLATNTGSGQPPTYLLAELDYPYDNADKYFIGTKQQVNLLSPVFDNGTPGNRKDFFTLRAQLNTGGDPLAVTLILEEGTRIPVGNLTYNGNTTGIAYIDLLQIGLDYPSRNFQFALNGTFTQFQLQDIGIHFETRPNPLTSLRLFNNNFGSATKKRLRVWPHIIDTRGNNVTAQLIADGRIIATSTWNSNSKTTQFIHVIEDDFAIDYDLQLRCSNGGVFEYFGAMNPEIVQTFPIAKRYDQVGPEEIFRYGKVANVGVRIYANDTTSAPGNNVSIPFTVYFDDNNTYTDIFTIPNKQDTTAMLGTPKGVSGAVLRIELGPTTFDFHRYYVRALIKESGGESEGKWVTLGQ